MPREERPCVKELNQHLVCVLCGGYFVDATTIIECLHSFCRTCIVRYLETSKYCPICDVQVHKKCPLSSIRRDTILQNLVYKLVPGLLSGEVRKRKAFLLEHTDEDESRLLNFEEGNTFFFAEDERISFSLEYSVDGKPIVDRRKRKKSSKREKKISESIKSESQTTSSNDGKKEGGNDRVPDPLSSAGSSKGKDSSQTNSSKEQSSASGSNGKKAVERKDQKKGSNLPEKRYLLGPAAMTIAHLKKFVRMKFDLPHNFEIEIFNKDETLDESYTLMDVAYIFSWQRREPMRFFYTIYEVHPRKKQKTHHVTTNKERIKSESSKRTAESCQNKDKLSIANDNKTVAKESKPPPVSNKTQKVEDMDTDPPPVQVAKDSTKSVNNNEKDNASTQVKKDTKSLSKSLSSLALMKKSPVKEEAPATEAKDTQSKKPHSAPLHSAFPLLNAHAQAQREASRKGKDALLQGKQLPIPSTSPIRRQAPQPVQLPKGLQQKHTMHSMTSTKLDAQLPGTSSPQIQKPTLQQTKPKLNTSQYHTPTTIPPSTPTSQTKTGLNAVQHRSLPQIVQPRQSGQAVQPRFSQQNSSSQKPTALQQKQKGSKAAQPKSSSSLTVRARLNAQSANNNSKNGHTNTSISNNSEQQTEKTLVSTQTNKPQLQVPTSQSQIQLHNQVNTPTAKKTTPQSQQHQPTSVPQQQQQKQQLQHQVIQPPQTLTKKNLLQHQQEQAKQVHQHPPQPSPAQPKQQAQPKQAQPKQAQPKQAQPKQAQQEQLPVKTKQQATTAKQQATTAKQQATVGKQPPTPQPHKTLLKQPVLKNHKQHQQQHIDQQHQKQQQQLQPQGLGQLPRHSPLVTAHQGPLSPAPIAASQMTYPKPVSQAAHPTNPLQQSPQGNAHSRQSPLPQQNKTPQQQPPPPPSPHPAHPSPHVVHMQVAQRPPILPVQSPSLQSSPPTLQLQPVNVSTPPPGMQMTPPTLQPQTPPIILGPPSAIPLLHPPVLQPLNLVTRGSPIQTSPLPVHSQPHLIHALPSPMQAMQQPPLLMSQQTLMTSPSHIMTSPQPMLVPQPSMMHPPPSPVPTHIHITSQQFQHLQAHAASSQQHTSQMQPPTSQHLQQPPPMVNCVQKDRGPIISTPNIDMQNIHSGVPISGNNNIQRPSNGQTSPTKYAAPPAKNPPTPTTPSDGVSSNAPSRQNHSGTDSENGSKKNSHIHTHHNGKSKEGSGSHESEGASTHARHGHQNGNKRHKSSSHTEGPAPINNSSKPAVSHTPSDSKNNNNDHSQNAMIKSNATTQTTAKPVPTKSSVSKPTMPVTVSPPQVSKTMAPGGAETPVPISKALDTSGLPATEQVSAAMNQRQALQLSQTTTKHNSVTPNAGSNYQSSSATAPAQTPLSSPVINAGQSAASSQTNAQTNNQTDGSAQSRDTRSPPQEEPLELKVNSKVPNYVAVS